jgi:FkbM family methyltransferase
MMNKPHKSDPWLGRWPLIAYQQAKALIDPVVRHANAERRQRKTFFSELFGCGDLVFDIGANHGLRSRHFLELGARVVAVEPQPHCAAELRSCLGRHPRFRLEETALGTTAGTLTLRICENCDVLTTALPPGQMVARFNDPQFHWREHTVPMTTLDALIARHGLPAFCKIDVEGYEERVLAGLSQPLPALSLEFMTDTLPMLERCCLKLLSLGQYRFRFSEADTLTWQHDGWLGWDDMRRHLQQLGAANADLWGDVYAKRT